MKRIFVFLLYGCITLLSLLPLQVLYVLSDFLWLIIFYIIRYRRPLVQQHLADSFPDKASQELRTIERHFYHWFCDYLVESIKMLTMSERQIKRRMTFKGTEIVDQIAREGQSCAIYLGHYCNWEWITSFPLWITPEVQCGQIYHVLESPDFDKFFLDLRQRWGAVCIPMAETLRRIIKYKQENKQVVIGYISDQVPFWNNIHHWLQFLQQDTPVLTGTERLARSAGHAVFYLDVRRLRRGYYEAEFKLIERDPKKTHDYELTDAYFSMLEKSILRDPQCYLWTHNRWKRSHEEFNLRYDKETGCVSLEPLEVIKKRKGLL
jgi:KDO2-lipid IV(A) lauroyltransferase